MVLDRLAVIPVLAEHDAAVFEALCQAGDGRHDGLGTGGHDELVKGIGGLLAALEVARDERLAGNVHGEHVGAHVHVRAQFGQRGRGGVEHAVGVAHVTTHPQGDATGEERQRVVALEDVYGPAGVRGEDAWAAKVPACVHPTTATVLGGGGGAHGVSLRWASARRGARRDVAGASTCSVVR